MKKIEAVITPFKLDEVKEALEKEKIQGMTIFEGKDFSRQKGHIELYRGAKYVVDITPKVKIEVIVEDDEVGQVADTVIAALRTGHLGDGEVAILPM